MHTSTTFEYDEISKEIRTHQRACIREVKKRIPRYLHDDLDATVANRVQPALDKGLRDIHALCTFISEHPDEDHEECRKEIREIISDCKLFVEEEVRQWCKNCV